MSCSRSYSSRLGVLMSQAGVGVPFVSGGVVDTGGGGRGGSFLERKGSSEWIVLSCLASLFLFHSA